MKAVTFEEIKEDEVDEDEPCTVEEVEDDVPYVPPVEEPKTSDESVALVS